MGSRRNSPFVGPFVGPSCELRQSSRIRDDRQTRIERNATARFVPGVAGDGHSVGSPCQHMPAKARHSVASTIGEDAGTDRATAHKPSQSPRDLDKMAGLTIANPDERTTSRRVHATQFGARVCKEKGVAIFSDPWNRAPDMWMTNTLSK